MQQQRLFPLLLILLFSCAKKEESYVARYKNYTLTAAELKDLVPIGTAKEDSIAMVNNYIEEWLKEKILLENSKDILNEDKRLEIETKVEQYRNDLILNKIEEEWILKNPPQEPTETEILEFYNQNPDIIPVKNTVLEYLLISPYAKDTDKAEALLKKEKLKELKSLAVKEGYPHQLNENQWISWEDFLKITNLPTDTPKAPYLKENKVIKTQQGRIFTLVKILNYAQEGTPAPLSYAKKTLKSILLNKRKLNLLSIEKDKLYQKAIYDKEIERQ